MRFRDDFPIYGVIVVALAALPAMAQPGDTRRIPLQGQDNFRTLGGYKTADGRAVKPSVLFRSGNLDQLTDADLAKLKELGIKTVIDLRTDYEVKKAPDKLPAGVKYVRAPVMKDEEVKKFYEDLAKGDLTKSPLFQPGGKVGPYDLLDPECKARYAAAFAKVFEAAADPAAHPIVFHCAGGRDRTGIAAALILECLGVPRETTLEDYRLTDKYVDPQESLKKLRKMMAERQGVKEDQVDMDAVKRLLEGFRKDTDRLRRTLMDLEAKYGSVEKYLAEELRIGEKERARLRDALLLPKQHSDRDSSSLNESGKDARVTLPRSPRTLRPPFIASAA
jgi:protein-tyrosine phosphatase